MRRQHKYVAGRVIPENEKIMRNIGYSMLFVSLDSCCDETSEAHSLYKASFVMTYDSAYMACHLQLFLERVVPGMRRSLVSRKLLRCGTENDSHPSVVSTPGENLNQEKANCAKVENSTENKPDIVVVSQMPCKGPSRIIQTAEEKKRDILKSAYFEIKSATGLEMKLTHAQHNYLAAKYRMDKMVTMNLERKWQMKRASAQGLQGRSETENAPEGTSEASNQEAPDDVTKSSNVASDSKNPNTEACGGDNLPMASSEVDSELNASKKVFAGKVLTPPITPPRSAFRGTSLNRTTSLPTEDSTWKRARSPERSPPSSIKRKKNYWTREEDELLKLGMWSHYGKWKLIEIEHFMHGDYKRTNVQIKDRADWLMRKKPDFLPTEEEAIRARRRERGDNFSDDGES